MYGLIMKARRLVAQHPRFAVWLANLIVRFPALRGYLARRYNIVLPHRPTAGVAPPGYRLPLPDDAAQLPADARAVLEQLRRPAPGGATPRP